MKIYLDIDGTMIHEDLGDNYGKPAKGLDEFLQAVSKHDCYWLTTHCMNNDPTRPREIVKRVVREQLHAFIDTIKPTAWGIMKTEVLDWDSEFIWFDNDFFDEERAAFSRAPGTQSFIEVDLKSNPGQLEKITHDILK